MTQVHRKISQTFKKRTWVYSFLILFKFNLQMSLQSTFFSTIIFLMIFVSLRLFCLIKCYVHHRIKYHSQMLSVFMAFICLRIWTSQVWIYFPFVHLCFIVHSQFTCTTNSQSGSQSSSWSSKWIKQLSVRVPCQFIGGLVVSCVSSFRLIQP